MQMLMFSLEERHVNPSQSQDSEKDWLILVATSCSPTSLLQTDTSLNGLSGKTSPVSCPADPEGILVPSSGRWGKSGMGGPTESWTHSTSEWTGLEGLCLKDDGVCSLSDVLETGEVPQRYYLSAKAC